MQDIEDTNRQVERTMSRELAARKQNSKVQGQGSTRTSGVAGPANSLPVSAKDNNNLNESAIIAGMLGEDPQEEEMQAMVRESQNSDQISSWQMQQQQ